MAEKWQIRMIKTLQTRLGLAEEEYREILRQYGVNSSLKLSRGKANDLIDQLGRLAEAAGKWKRQKREKKKYADLDGRPGDFATSAQVRMVEAAWAEVSRARTAEGRSRALDVFGQRITGKFRKEAWCQRDVEKLMQAIKAMKKQKEKGKA
ncbi:MAG: hypothetical protein Kow0037_01000 [Calditrichia bacterium]